MTKFMRVCAAVLAVGAVLCIGGAAAGGRVYSSVRNGVLRPIRWHLPSLEVEGDDGERQNDGRIGISRGSGSVWDPPKVDVGDIHTGLEDIPEDVPENLPEDIPEEVPSITSLKKLDFELGAGNYQIVEGAAYGLSYDGDWIDSRIEDGVWRIRTDTNLFSLNHDLRACTITVPAGCEVEKLDWEIGAANVEVTAAIAAENADLEVGAGNLEMHALNVQKGLELEVGAGNADLCLAGSWEDYRITAEIAMGTISINGSDLITGLAGSCTKGNGPKKIKAEAGMGSICIFTEDNFSYGS